MNINISHKRKTDSNLTMGLNTRGRVESRTNVRNRSSRSALDDSDTDDDDNDDDNPTEESNHHRSGRDAVNRSIAKQQAAIRAQAVASAMSIDASIYDYDGVYDTLHNTDPNAAAAATATVTTSTSSTTDSRKSRYIEDLMKTAKVRKMERDIAYDRKVARDQQVEEEAEPEFRNKDRFITSSYKRQLEERHQYQQQESIRQQMEEQHDITKRSDGGLGIASFYGNITQQIPFSNATTGATTTDQEVSKDVTAIDQSKNPRHYRGF